MQHTFYLVSLFVFGLIFGSFGNVVIWRLPRAESLSVPGSHCPRCGHAIRWYDNVPLVSWALLAGRCRDCGTPISPRYPAIELLSGCLWVAAGIAFGISWRALAAVALFYLVLLLGAIDLDTMRLPNALVAIVAAVGLAGATVSQLTGTLIVPLTPPVGSGPVAAPLSQAVLGVALGAGMTALIGYGYGRVRGQAGFGMGDYKLLAAAGLFLGPYVLVALLAGSLLSLVAVVGMSRDGDAPVGRRRIPFGPFLAAGIVVAALAGPALIAWYVSLIGAM